VVSARRLRVRGQAKLMGGSLNDVGADPLKLRHFRNRIVELERASGRIYMRMFRFLYRRAASHSAGEPRFNIPWVLLGSWRLLGRLQGRIGRNHLIGKESGDLTVSVPPLDSTFPGGCEVWWTLFRTREMPDAGNFVLSRERLCGCGCGAAVRYGERYVSYSVPLVCTWI
jgi:hypothetical protein